MVYSGTAVWLTTLSTVGRQCVCVCWSPVELGCGRERETIDVATVGSDGKSADAVPLALGAILQV